jgi:hypothetical protein
MQKRLVDPIHPSNMRAQLVSPTIGDFVALKRKRPWAGKLPLLLVCTKGYAQAI